MFDLAIIVALSVAGLFRYPMGLIALGAGLLAASPIARFYVMARASHDIDTRQRLRQMSIQAALRAMAAAIAAYLVGRLVSVAYAWPSVIDLDLSTTG